MSLSMSELRTKMSAECGTAVDVTWSFRLFQVICRRLDGEPLTPSMEAAFEQLLKRALPSTPATGLR